MQDEAGQAATASFLNYGMIRASNLRFFRFEKWGIPTRTTPLGITVCGRAGTTFFSFVAMVDADGRNLGTHRKSHIPQGPGYGEKYNFSPGETGFRVCDTAFGRIGVGICWDQ